MIMMALKRVGSLVRRPMFPLYTWSTQRAADAPTKNNASWMEMENIRTRLYTRLMVRDAPTRLNVCQPKVCEIG